MSSFSFPTAASIVWLLSVAVLGVLFWQAHQQGGGLAYPLDDTYIHAAVARNLADTGTWGVTPGQFASATSAPAWVVGLAAAFLLVGDWVWFPLFFSVVAGFAALWVADCWLQQNKMSLRERTLSLMVLCAVIPMPTLMGLGMEHTLQLGLIFLLGLSPKPPNARRLWWVCLCAGVMPMVRYESCFFLGWLGLLWIVRGARSAGVAVWVAGASSVLLFGGWSAFQGASWVPNGMIMKSRFPNQALDNLLANLYEGVPVWGVALIVLFWGRRDRWASWLFFATTMTHLIVADLGWFYRYEAYLVGWGVLLLLSERPFTRTLRVWGLGLGGGLILLSPRAYDAMRYLPGRCVYILDAKVRLAQSLSDVAPGSGLALHDIGAMVWYGNVRITDVAGLGDDAVAHLSASGHFTGTSIASLVDSRGAVLGVATASWMAHDPPPGWAPVAQLEWGLDGEHFIEPFVFYALKPEGEALGRAWAEDAAGRMGGRARWAVLPRD